MGKAKPSGKEAKGKDGPTCGSCHGALEPRGIHYIQKYPKKPKTWRDSEYWTEFRFSSDKVCGQCHMDRVKSYNDYYHGRAYKTREVDSPACWTCHNQHDVFPKKELRSSISSDNLPKTCGRCHPEPSESFTDQYAEMIHGRDNLYKNNFILQYARGVDVGGPFGWIGEKMVNTYDTVVGWLKAVAKFFLPENLRPQQEAQD
jgi:nitrate/TMAO reductase-like tetraheme cytochrome c subunit